MNKLLPKMTIFGFTFPSCLETACESFVFYKKDSLLARENMGNKHK